MYGDCSMGLGCERKKKARIAGLLFVLLALPAVPVSPAAPPPEKPLPPPLGFEARSVPNAVTAAESIGSFHLITLFWDLGNDLDEFDSCSVDVLFLDDLPDSCKLFISPLGGKINGNDYYSGFITRIPDVITRNNRIQRHIGRGLIFSRWGDTSAENIRPSRDGFFFTGVHEGPNASVRPPYLWKKGRYRLQVNRMDREGTKRFWIGCFVYDYGNDENFFVGGLRFDGAKLKLNQYMSSFVEVFGDSPQQKLPKFSLVIGNLAVNGKKQDQLDVIANVPKRSRVSTRGIPLPKLQEETEHLLPDDMSQGVVLRSNGNVRDHVNESYYLYKKGKPWPE